MCLWCEKSGKVDNLSLSGQSLTLDQSLQFSSLIIHISPDPINVYQWLMPDCLEKSSSKIMICQDLHRWLQQQLGVIVTYSITWSECDTRLSLQCVRSESSYTEVSCSGDKINTTASVCLRGEMPRLKIRGCLKSNKYLRPQCSLCSGSPNTHNLSWKSQVRFLADRTVGCHYPTSLSKQQCSRYLSGALSKSPSQRCLRTGSIGHDSVREFSQFNRI